MSTATLWGWQRDFSAALLDDGRRLQARIVGDATADAPRRIGVYVHAYRMRLVEVLSADYAVLRQRLGAAHFDALAAAYLAEHPSCTPSVRDVGRHFPAWLRRRGAARTEVDLAAFEWLQGEVFDAADAPHASADMLTGLAAEAWPDLRLMLHPALRTLRLRSNAPAQFAAHDAHRPLPAAQRMLDETVWLLWRREMVVHWRELDADEAAALAALRAGESFGALCERLLPWHHADDAAWRAASLLKRWLDDGLIVAARRDSIPAVSRTLP